MSVINIYLQLLPDYQALEHVLLWVYCYAIILKAGFQHGNPKVLRELFQALVSFPCGLSWQYKLSKIRGTLEICRSGRSSWPLLLYIWDNRWARWGTTKGFHSVVSSYLINRKCAKGLQMLPQWQHCTSTTEKLGFFSHQCQGNLPRARMRICISERAANVQVITVQINLFLKHAKKSIPYS